MTAYRLKIVANSGFTNLPELHDKVHEAAGSVMGLLRRSHRRLQQVFYGDLILQSLVQETLSAGEVAICQDLNLKLENITF